MKAFDKVPHKQLLQIIEYYSLPLKVTKWVKDFLSNGKQQVLINGVPSQWHTVLSDVPEGSVLGPILLVLCINTLIEVVDNSKLLLFADDNKLFMSFLKIMIQQYYKKVLKQCLIGQETHYRFFARLNVLQ